MPIIIIRIIIIIIPSTERIQIMSGHNLKYPLDFTAIITTTTTTMPTKTMVASTIMATIQVPIMP